ncbi:hypothetical protein UFOVP273_115 [uncultured Caudovirales phage]|uniref:Uncharacterized protein n=1 Tax=uncultured Caudovirales phage TaxID=2100421 RepID=A0A6J5LNK6_9CAUD|nr:hypothetical protein UFOVP273_115 [uncultured Caudovirales phage]
MIYQITQEQLDQINSTVTTLKAKVQDLINNGLTMQEELLKLRMYSTRLEAQCALLHRALQQTKTFLTLNHQLAKDNLEAILRDQPHPLPKSATD